MASIFIKKETFASKIEQVLALPAEPCITPYKLKGYGAYKAVKSHYKIHKNNKKSKNNKNKKFNGKSCNQKEFLLNLLKTVVVEKRLGILIQLSDLGNWIAPKKRKQARKEFEKIKEKILPLEGVFCYCCKQYAKHRHHVVPLCFGGKNSKKNLVPLCTEHHLSLHPWMEYHNSELDRAFAAAVS